MIEASTAQHAFHFAADSGFHGELKRRVEAHLRDSGVSPRHSWRMYLKTALILAWFGTSYGLLVFAATTLWQGLLLSVSLALAMAGIGFSIQHDANHAAYSGDGAFNRWMGMTLDLMGGSSYVWRFKHTIFHHTYPNLVGADEDIDVGPFGRLAPGQPRFFLHRYQQYYLWLLYGLLSVKWHFLDDFKNALRGRIGLHRFPRPRRWELVELVAGKLTFYGWALVLPAFFHRPWVVLVFYALISFVLGVTLAVVFQLAHCVGEAEFPEPPPAQPSLDTPWAVHQLRTTVDFSPRSRLLTWYLGGLNFQIEHHLFPRICHIHYPRIAPIVREVCEEFDVQYRVNDGFFGALASHFRWLRSMGRPPRVGSLPV